MKKLQLILLIFLAAAAVPAAAQAQGREAVVRLHNGSVIRGTVTEMEPEESLKIETRDGNSFVFRMDEVALIEMERPEGYTRDRRVKTTYPARSKFNKPRGYLGLVEVGSGSWANHDESSTSITMVNGYRFFPQLAIGGGVGIEAWEDGDWAMPLFLHLRSDFIRNRVSPFVALNLGMNVSADYNRSGPMFELQGGVSFNVARRFRMTVGLSLAAMDNEDYYYSGDNYFHDDRYYDGALKLKVGFSF